MKTATMKAVRIHAYGGPDELRLEDAPVPEPGAGEVRVRVHAAGVNPVDWKTRRGMGVAAGRAELLPLVPGWDVSGVVDAAGAEVTELVPGDEVYGMIRFPEIGGAYAELATAPATHVARKPPSLSHEEAAALPLAGLAAWQALFDAAGLREAQAVLVHAAAGGVGHLAVQLAKWKGARVTGTASGSNEGLVRELGADHFVDYTRAAFDEVVCGMDVVLDAVGGETLERSYAVLRPGGMLVTLAGTPSGERAAQLGVRALRVRVHPSRPHLDRLRELVEDGYLRVRVDSVLPLARAREAHRRSESHRARGKIVLRVAG